MSQINAQSIHGRLAVVLSKWFTSVSVVAAVLTIPAVITAQESTQKNNPPPAQSSDKSADDELADLRKQVQDLTAEVDRLKREVAKLERYRQIDYLRDLLMKEEEHLELLQGQLVDIGGKEIPLQTRLDEIEQQLRPDRVEQSLAGIGSMRPEEDRDAVRRQLANERRRIMTQLDLLRQNRMRLQTFLNTADTSISRLRLRLNEAAAAR